MPEHATGTNAAIRWDDLTEFERLFVLSCLDANESDSARTLRERADALEAFVADKKATR